MVGKEWKQEREEDKMNGWKGMEARTPFIMHCLAFTPIQHFSLFLFLFLNGREPEEFQPGGKRCKFNGKL